MNPDVTNMIRAWRPPPPCDRVGCGALHPPGTYHGPAMLEKDFGDLQVVALVKHGDEGGWTVNAHITQVWTGPWTSGEAVIRFPDDSTANIIIEECRFEARCYAELACRGLGAPPAVIHDRRTV